MNLLRLSIFLLLTISLSSCGSDDEDSVNCVVSDWVGVYDGKVNCDGTEEDVTVTITASGADAIVIVYETATLTTEFDPLSPEGCNLNATSSAGGLSLSVDASLDGDNFNFEEILSDGGNTSNCTIAATRK